MKTAVVLRVRSKSDNSNVFITQDENVMVFTEKEYFFSFYFIVYTPMRVSDVITNVTKQNMNVMASTFSAYHVNCWIDKNKKFRQIKKKKKKKKKKKMLLKCSLHSN